MDILYILLFGVRSAIGSFFIQNLNKKFGIKNNFDSNFVVFDKISSLICSSHFKSLDIYGLQQLVLYSIKF